MIREYFLVYLIYGFAMINMGIFCLKEKNSGISGLSLLKSLKFLGWFGFIHGISEWVTLLMIANLYPDYNLYLYNLIQILKGLSFAFLMHFGLDLLRIKSTYKKVVKILPVSLFIIIFVGYIILIINNGLNYHRLNRKYSIVTIRYALALTSGILSALALILNSRLIEKQKSIKVAKRYRQLAWVILVNGLLEGLLVQKSDFFPANIINRDMFNETFQFQTLFIKAIIGLLINYLLVKVIDTFSWEQEERLKKLEKHRIASEERRKLGLEVHDGIIQLLYAVGLKVEFLLVNKDEKLLSEKLNDIKDDLNNTIDRAREFMDSTALDTIEPDDLKENIEQIIKKYSENQDIEINLKCEISPLMKGNMSTERSTQIYYIVQEAISNISKHSKATRGDVILETKYDMINISVIDNGIGLKENDLQKDKHIGRKSMKERAERIGGQFSITNLIKGLKVNVEIPWEESVKD